MNPATALATVLVDELVRCGLSDAVLAPGSRSAPLALALHEAELAGRLRLHVRIDERSAAFLALGLARGGSRPAAVACTSGTAAANLHPAVLEAAEAGVPMLVLTADRPPELRGTGANQTVDQIKMFGSAPRWFFEMGVPEARAGAVTYWRSVACRSWGTAAGPDPGPVHLNLSFREPLDPDRGAPAWPEPLGGRSGGAPWTWTPQASSTPAGAVPIDGQVREPEPDPGWARPAIRGLLVAGDGQYNPEPYVALAEARGWPILAEPTSNARYGANAISVYHHLLAVPGFAERHRPDLVVTVGKPGLSRPLLTLIQGALEHVAVPTTTRWPDPTRSVTRVQWPASSQDGRPGDTRNGGVNHAAVASPWLTSWLRAERTARAALDAVLDAGVGSAELRLARDLAAALPDGALLFAGSSMPIRDLDRSMRPRRGLRILGNRGASGIDGLVSTAIGAALAHDRPAYALIGDVSLLHDQNGLIVGSAEPHPNLTFVVVDNDGGGIFSTLPHAEQATSFERVFATPHGVRVADVARTAGVSYAELSGPADLVGLLPGPGLRILCLRTDRAAEAALRRRCQTAVDDALAAVESPIRSAAGRRAPTTR